MPSKSGVPDVNMCRPYIIRSIPAAVGSLIVGTVLVLAWGGCAYRLGPTNGELSGARSVQVNVFENKTIEPRLGELVTTSVRKYIQKDGTYRLDTSGDGDIVVTGTIVEYRRMGLSYVSTDIITPQDYVVSLVAQVTARERGTGKVLLERKVGGRTTVRVGSDLSSAERQAAPLLAEDLARNITSVLVDGTW